MAVAGDDYCIVGASKRLSTGYSILTRDQTKICRLCVVFRELGSGAGGVYEGAPNGRGFIIDGACGGRAGDSSPCPSSWQHHPRLPCGCCALARSSKVVVASAGMQADRQALHKTLHSRHVMYQFNHRRPMSTGAVAQLLSNTLYNRRFFPLYTFNLCCGLNEEGQGAIHTYDAVGSHELVGYSCQGSGRELMQPVLDSQLKAASPLVLPPQVG